MNVIIKANVRLVVNGLENSLEVKSNETLANVLRDKLDLTGTKIGCDEGECGACTVLINREPVASCLTLAIDCDGKNIETIEGLADSKTGELHLLQKAFVEHHGAQCGFCTPGMIMTSKALLDETPSPSRQEIRAALNGNICRCTGYVNIVDSVLAASKMIKK
jgi:carbon-monoxide dehydrogenase small subunit